MVPRPLTAALVVCCVIALALNVVFDGPPGAAMVLAGVVGAALALTRSPDPTPALQPAGRHHLDKPPTFTEHELAAFAALTDDDRDEMARLGFDLTGLPTSDATPAPDALSTANEQLLAVDTVQTSDDGWVRITASDGSRIEYPLVDAEQPPAAGDPVDPDAGFLPDAATAWRREAGARVPDPVPLSDVAADGRFRPCPTCSRLVLRRAMHRHVC